MSRILLVFIFLFLFSKTILPQINSMSAGGYIGLGSVKGNSPSQTSFNTTIFLDVQPEFMNRSSLRLSLIYGRKIEALLPQSVYDRYFPFVKGISLKVTTKQRFQNLFYTEETIGPLLLNDRTFSDVNSLDLGLSFSFLAGLDFRTDARGMALGLGTEYGLTFTNTLASYFALYLQAQYYFL
ncbi:MAG TPA: hypothetical protein VHO03_02090 [Ignavibacteriales bacterium]|nr:hypothetical protein [Ignavibacteriales bacterium]